MSPLDRGQDGRGAEEQVHMPQQDVHRVPGLRPRGGRARGQSGIRGTACPGHIYVGTIKSISYCMTFYERSQFGEVL